MHRYCSDVIIHIDEDLPDDDIHEIERDLGAVPGVYSRLCKRPRPASAAGRL